MHRVQQFFSHLSRSRPPVPILRAPTQLPFSTRSATVLLEATKDTQSCGGSGARILSLTPFRALAGCYIRQRRLYRRMTLNFNELSQPRPRSLSGGSPTFDGSAICRRRRQTQPPPPPVPPSLYRARLGSTTLAGQV